MKRILNQLRQRTQNLLNIRNKQHSIRNRFGLKSQSGLLFGASGNPGPGTYNCKELIGKEGVKSTMPPRRPDTAPAYGRNVPGPGTYNTVGGKNGPSYKYVKM